MSCVNIPQRATDNESSMEGKVFIYKFYQHSKAKGALSYRQFKALWLAAHECSCKIIALRLGISDTGAEKLFESIYKILGVHTIKGAIHQAWNLGIFNKGNC